MPESVKLCLNGLLLFVFVFSVVMVVVFCLIVFVCGFVVVLFQCFRRKLRNMSAWTHTHMYINTCHM